uniref:Uncharacterized protein n=1 Tax=Arion vulgaris TaxID=1028688 RepID=A0A0B7AML7_9EUPU
MLHAACYYGHHLGMECGSSWSALSGMLTLTCHLVHYALNLLHPKPTQLRPKPTPSLPLHPLRPEPTPPKTTMS